MVGDAAALSACIETLHAVTYFAPESHEAARDVGFKGFWMGYFGFRAAPLGEADADTVTATFFNFHPSMVARAVPDSWQFAGPVAALDARATSAAAALRRLVPDIATVADACTTDLEALAAHVNAERRPLGKANRSLAQRADPVERLWQACTTLRELRGDAHVELLGEAGLDGCQAHVVAAAHKGTPAATLRDNRGWTDDDWQDAVDSLTRSGWLAADGTLSVFGREERDRIEEMTDALAFASGDDLEDLVDRLAGRARTLWESRVIPWPNPMGLAGPPP